MVGEEDLLLQPKWVAENRGHRLFIKNTGLCEHASGCIETDACPVSEKKKEEKENERIEETQKEKGKVNKRLNE